MSKNKPFMVLLAAIVVAGWMYTSQTSQQIVSMSPRSMMIIVNPNEGTTPVPEPLDTICYHNFDDSLIGGVGTSSPLTHPWAGAKPLDFPNVSQGAPAGGPGGRVARPEYQVIATQSDENGVFCNAISADRPSYNDTTWWQGSFYLEFPDTGLATDTRKLFDSFSSANGGVRITLLRDDAQRNLRMDITDCRTGTETSHYTQDQSMVIPDSTWVMVKLRIIQNSADGVADGDVLIISESAPQGVDTAEVLNQGSWTHSTNCGGTNLDQWAVGYQLTSNLTYDEFRYWDEFGVYKQEPPN